MVGARLLQAPLHVIVEADAIANQDGDDDGCRLRVVAPDVPGHGGPGKVPDLGGSLRRPRAALQHLHQRAALHAAHQDGPLARELQPSIGHAGVLVAPRFVHQGRNAEQATGPPLPRPLEAERPSRR